jgi:hypothetical protein
VYQLTITTHDNNFFRVYVDRDTTSSLQDVFDSRHRPKSIFLEGWEDENAVREKSLIVVTHCIAAIEVIEAHDQGCNCTFCGGTDPP